ncbi:MAG: hypothetical protein K0B09_03295, partial [Bacteroidales bacterium]|nr:hypothetical protein [Bacteroidales bacterium]
MKLNSSALLLSFLVFFLSSQITHANSNSRQPGRPNGRISVFLDTESWFDHDFVRQQIPVVNYVRDREQADVHIIITRHNAGSAGTNYAISFIGNRAFLGIDNDLTYWAAATNSSDETRRGYTNILKIGLVSYLSSTTMIDRVLVDFFSETTDALGLEEETVETDPWNNWVFEIYGGGNFGKEEKLSNYTLRTGFYADRVTTNWKIRLRPYLNFNNRTYVTTAGDIVNSTHRHGYS